MKGIEGHCDGSWIYRATRVQEGSRIVLGRGRKSAKSGQETKHSALMEGLFLGVMSNGFRLI